MRAAIGTKEGECKMGIKGSLGSISRVGKQSPITEVPRPLFCGVVSCFHRIDQKRRLMCEIRFDQRRWMTFQRI